MRIRNNQARICPPGERLGSLTLEMAPSRKGKQTTIKANAATNAYHPLCLGMGLIFIFLARPYGCDWFQPDAFRLI